MNKTIFAFIFIFSFHNAFSQINYTAKSELKKVVRDFEKSISSKDTELFNKLFFSEEVSFVGIMSKETEYSIKKDYEQFEGTSISDSRSFIKSIVETDKKFKEKIYHIETNTDGMIASVDFDYAFYSGKNMKQWGHQKWNLVYSNDRWLITDAVYSVHFPNVEECPFESIKNESLNTPTKPGKLKNSGKKPAKKLNSTNTSKISNNNEEAVEEKPKPVTKTLTVLINSLKKGPLYAGAGNKVEINYRDLPPEKISVFCSADNVEMHKNDDGSFYFKPLKKIPDFAIHIRAGGKTIEYTMRVDVLPNPKPLLSKRYTGPVNALEFQSHQGLLASTKSFSVRAKCIITGFTVTRQTPGGKKTTVKNKGGRFQNKTQVLVRAARSKDTYLFEKITCQCPGDGNSRKLENLKFIIK